MRYNPSDIVKCSICSREYDTEEDGYCCDDTATHDIDADDEAHRALTAANELHRRAPGRKTTT